MKQGGDPSIQNLAAEIKSCVLCQAHLPLGPRPVFQIHSTAKILVVGQAPGRRVHETGIPFNDPSGVRLRQWMGIDENVFYNPEQIALLPMGFCYPGTGKSGDLPPRPECAEKWRARILQSLVNIKLTLIIGQYAQAWHLKDRQKDTLTETVRNWKDYWPDLVPLPHPSPRNNIWLKKNPWFETDLVPKLRQRVSDAL
jgi:uracil-DNA glycosylase